jgi:hypothetical protein
MTEFDEAARRASESVRQQADAVADTEEALSALRSDQGLHRPEQGTVRRRAMVAAGLVAAVSLGVIAVAALGADDTTTIVTGTVSDSVDAPATSEAASTTTSASTAPIVETSILQSDEVAGRRWIQIPTDDQHFFQYEPEVRFADDGLATGYNGCSPWEARVVVTPPASPGQAHTIEFDPPPEPSSCSSSRLNLLEGSVRVVEDRWLEVLDDDGAVEDTYIAADTLSTSTPENVAGVWRTGTGTRLELLADGRATLGICPADATWTLDDGQLTILGFDTSEALACAGGSVSGVILSLPIGEPDTAITARVAVNPNPTGAGLLLDRPDGAVWLQPALPTSAFDLDRMTAYDFGAPADIDADFVVDTISAVAGRPTFDTGWYISETFETGVDETDCLGGIEMRMVVWGDVLVGFLRIDTLGDRLFITGVGTIQSLPRYAGPMPTPVSEPTLTSQGVGPGSTIDELAAAGYPLRGFTDDAGARADSSSATKAVIDGSVRFGEVTLDGGIVVNIMYTNPGFC